MNEDYNLGLLLQLVRNISEWLLTERQEIAPYSIKLLGDSAQPKTFFPLDENPELKWPTLFEMAVSALRSGEDEKNVVGVAACTPLSTDDDAGRTFGAQLETPNVSTFVFFRYRADASAWQIEDPEFLETLLVPDGLRWQPLTRELVLKEN